MLNILPKLKLSLSIINFQFSKSYIIHLFINKVPNLFPIEKYRVPLVDIIVGDFLYHTTKLSYRAFDAATVGGGGAAAYTIYFEFDQFDCNISAYNDYCLQLLAHRQHNNQLRLLQPFLSGRHSLFFPNYCGPAKFKIPTYIYYYYYYCWNGQREFN